MLVEMSSFGSCAVTERVSRVALCCQLDMARLVIETIETRDPPLEKEVGLRTLEDLYPIVTDQQKADMLEKFSVG